MIHEPKMRPSIDQEVSAAHKTPNGSAARNAITPATFIPMTTGPTDLTKFHVELGLNL